MKAPPRATMMKRTLMANTATSSRRFSSMRTMTRTLAEHRMHHHRQLGADTTTICSWTPSRAICRGCLAWSSPPPPAGPQQASSWTSASSSLPVSLPSRVPLVLAGVTRASPSCSLRLRLLLPCWGRSPDLVRLRPAGPDEVRLGFCHALLLPSFLPQVIPRMS